MRPWRAYITGTTEPNGKKHLNLIVETTKHKHPKYKEILQKIKDWKRTTLPKKNWSNFP